MSSLDTASLCTEHQDITRIAELYSTLHPLNIPTSDDPERYDLQKRWSSSSMYIFRGLMAALRGHRDPSEADHPPVCTFLGISWLHCAAIEILANTGSPRQARGDHTPHSSSTSLRPSKAISTKLSTTTQFSTNKITGGARVSPK